MCVCVVYYLAELSVVCTVYCNAGIVGPCMFLFLFLFFIYSFFFFFFGGGGGKGGS